MNRMLILRLILHLHGSSFLRLQK